MAAIYGANASGKTNVLRALDFFSGAIRRSHRSWNPDELVPRDRFLGQSIEGSTVSRFVADFALDDIEFQYGFELNDIGIQSEWLYAFPQQRKQEWFVRNLEGGFRFGSKLKGPNSAVRDITRQDSLFLSAARQSGHPQLRPIAKLLSSGLRIRMRPPVSLALDLENFLNESPSERDRLLTLLRAADKGIEDLRIDFRLKIRDGMGITSQRQLEKEPSEPIASRVTTSRDLVYVHRIEGERVDLGEAAQSEGTRTLAGELPRILIGLREGNLVGIDELDRSLHPQLTLAILGLFASPESNPKGAQLVFTTHDTSLLSSGILRRDEVWMCEKDSDGASSLFPLSDFAPRKNENLEKGYLQGRFGAVPHLNAESLLSLVDSIEVPVDDGR